MSDTVLGTMQHTGDSVPKSLFPRFKAAAVQATPVLLNRAKTTDKACRFIDEAAEHGADIVAFPEVYIPGYPFWSWLDSPLKTTHYFLDLVANAVRVPSETTEQIGEAARKGNIYVVMSVNELGCHSVTELYNTSLIFDRAGDIILRHRKLMPTFAEKLSWGQGDGSSLQVLNTDIGRLGVLNCGENGNSLLRYALIAQGEQVHVANYPGLSLAQQKGMYDMRRGIEIRSAAHSFEGKLFTIVSCGMLDEEMLKIICDTKEKRAWFNGNCNVYTAILNPQGVPIAGPLDPNVEGIAYADIDLTDIVQQKRFHDIAGNYNRYDVVSLNLNRRPIRQLWEAEGGELNAPADNVTQDHGASVGVERRGAQETGTP